MFTVHNFTATTHGATYDFDFFEHHRNGMIIGETPDLDIAIILPKRMSGMMQTYMLGAIKNYFSNIGTHSVVRHVGSLAFEEENTRHF